MDQDYIVISKAGTKLFIGQPFEMLGCDYYLYIYEIKDGIVTFGDKEKKFLYKDTIENVAREVL